MISEQRLREELHHMQTITAPDSGPGINRLAFTDSDWKGRDYLCSLMTNAGLVLRIDTFGNVIGHLCGKNESLPTIMFGSHGDSVPNGGNYDGVVGVLSAIEVVKSIQEDGFKNDNPLDVVLFMCEESSRFGSATLGSRAMCGDLSLDELKKLKDKNNNILYDVLKKRGLDPDHIAAAKYDKAVKAFFEVHIEQGKVLEHAGIKLGIVTGIAAPTRFRVHLHGVADHSGATPMNLRHDGSCAAAEIILQVEKLASAHSNPPVVGTVGVVIVHPDAMNVIPGEIDLGIDIRSISAQAKEKTSEEVCNAISTICKKRNIPFDIEEISNGTPVIMQTAVTSFLANLCKNDNLSYIMMPSGAGHDAMHWAMKVPTGMIFIPCKNGISHNSAEFTELKDIVLATHLLERTVRTVSNKDFHF